MGKKKALRRGYGKLTNPLYLNANLIYSEALNVFKDRKCSTLRKLGSEFELVTSTLTRLEVIQNLRYELNITPEHARKIYRSILEDHKILEITSLDRLNLLTDDFLERVAKSNLYLKDALHLEIARKYNNTPVCTHDKKMSGGRSSHEDKKKFYKLTSNPRELIKKKK